MQRIYQRLAAACVLALVVMAVCAPLASAVGSDWDSDSIRNALDNCMKQPNPTQRDLDGDGQGDVCDSDRDGDGQLNADDPCPDDALNGCIAPPPPPSSDPVFIGAGDIASSGAGDEAKARLLDQYPDATVFTTGDNVYENGTLSEFNTYYEPTWGRHKARTHPAVGNHEYRTLGAAGYFDYFGAAAGERGKGYYSYDVGSWHMIALNSNCSVVACDANSAQVAQLKGDLVTHSNQCTLAYFHHPLFSSGSGHGNNPVVKDLWDALYGARADVVLNGHDHTYERFAPQTPSGMADAQTGIREFVVGTGGRSLYGFNAAQPNSEVRYAGGFGVLKLTLHPSNYDWQFVSEEGKTFADSGSGSCH